VSGTDRDPLYQVVANRRLQYDNLVWQTPVLSLTAQAFLFSVSLGSGTRASARVIAASLSIVVWLMSIQVMAKHRLNEFTDGDWLEDYERERWGESLHGKSFVRRRRFTWYSWMSSYVVWIAGLSLFGVAALVTLGFVIWTQLLS